MLIFNGYNLLEKSVHLTVSKGKEKANFKPNEKHKQKYNIKKYNRLK